MLHERSNAIETSNANREVLCKPNVDASMLIIITGKFHCIYC